MLACPANTVKFDDLLVAATARATAQYPHDVARIAKALELVRAGLVTDMTRALAHTYTVGSEADPETIYAVVSNGETTCTCKDAVYRQSICKHGFAVLLVRSARRDFRPTPRYRHACYLVTGAEGYARTCGDSMIEFHPGGHEKSFEAPRHDFTLGPWVDGD
jgi:hypothetical protein